MKKTGSLGEGSIGKPSKLVDMETDKWRREMEPKMNAAKKDFKEGTKLGITILSILAVVVAVWLLLT